MTFSQLCFGCTKTLFPHPPGGRIRRGINAQQVTEEPLSHSDHGHAGEEKNIVQAVDRGIREQTSLPNCRPYPIRMDAPTPLLLPGFILLLIGGGCLFYGLLSIACRSARA